jgi:hypothetical protein
MNEKLDKLTKQKLKERGWTDSAIRKFLGEPDELKKNWLYSKAAPICLYSISKVEIIEKSDDFINWKIKSKIKGNAIKKSKKIIAQKIFILMKSWNPEIKILPLDEVKSLAIIAYNTFSVETGRDFYADENSDKRFLERIMVNYIRHNLTDYDYVLANTYRKIAKHDLIILAKSIVYDSIITNYPELSEEANRQKENNSADSFTIENISNKILNCEMI